MNVSLDPSYFAYAGEKFILICIWHTYLASITMNFDIFSLKKNEIINIRMAGKHSGSVSVSKEPKKTIIFLLLLLAENDVYMLIWMPSWSWFALFRATAFEKKLYQNSVSANKYTLIMIGINVYMKRRKCWWVTMGPSRDTSTFPTLNIQCHHTLLMLRMLWMIYIARKRSICEYHILLVQHLDRNFECDSKMCVNIYQHTHTHTRREREREKIKCEKLISIIDFW